MDGRAVLISMHPMYVRPWDDCIPMYELILRNLPPCYVRLRDDQVGDLVDWFRVRSAVAVSAEIPTRKRDLVQRDSR